MATYGQLSISNHKPYKQLLAFKINNMSLKKYAWTKEKNIVSVPSIIGALFLALVSGGGWVKYIVTLVVVMAIFSIVYDVCLLIWKEIYKGKILILYYVAITSFQLVFWGVVLFNFINWE